MTAAKYILFAIISTAVNILTQYITYNLYRGDFGLYVAMAAGTLTGLIAKYMLDKRYIFYHKTRGLRATGENFILYSLTGVITTAVFWGVEIGFHFVIGTESAKYIGGTAGLAIGYTLKYFLDKSLVFREHKKV